MSLRGRAGTASGGRLGCKSHPDLHSAQFHAKIMHPL